MLSDNPKKPQLKLNLANISNKPNIQEKEVKSSLKLELKGNYLFTFNYLNLNYKFIKFSFK